ncbi:MAG: hypothetical protein AB9907_15555 [Flexilinea sp.]
MPSIYCGAIVTFFVILFFLNQKIRAKEKWLTFGFFASFLHEFPNPITEFDLARI